MAFDVGKFLIDWFEALEEAVLEHVLVIIWEPRESYPKTWRDKPTQN